MKKPRLVVMARSIAMLSCMLGLAGAQSTRIEVQLGQNLGPMEIERYGLGQGGYDKEPAWPGRVAEIRALRPRLIRLFVQEYYDLLPSAKRYNWSKLDESVDMIVKTGAKPLMCITFKPKVLFPKMDQDLVEPTNWADWEELVYQTARHYKQRGSGIRYWEVGNEVDLQSGGGCPYHFTPANYPRYYQHTARAILKADPDARVGGPALANSNAPILPALLSFCDETKTPLHFVSWHIYNNDPGRFRQTTEGVKALLQKYPSLKPELVLDEWNMSLGSPNVDPRFQPCFIAEATYQMKEAGVDYSCYYHIRDVHIEPAQYARFMPPDIVASSIIAWNLRPQWDGLFDFQNTPRPAYFLFKLLSRLTGERVALKSASESVHGFAAHDSSLGTYSVLVWNFSKSPAQIEMALEGAPERLAATRFALDAAGANNDENRRINPLEALRITRDQPELRFELEPYGVNYLLFRQSRR